MRIYHKKTICVAILLVILLMQAMPKKAHAVFGVGDITFTTIVGDTSPTGISNSINITAEHIKEYVLDKLAYIAAKQILHQMTGDIINWINGGFNGKPAFLANPQAFFLDTADQITGRMIADNGALASLCSPWNVDVRLSLALEQATNNFRSTRYTCTLNTIAGNAENASAFLGGDFSVGGWSSFIDTTVGTDNPVAQYLLAKGEIQEKIDEKTDAINKDLDRGMGFLTFSQCETVPFQSGITAETTSDGAYISDNGDGTGTKCSAKTPGSAIAHMLNTSLDSPIVEAELANDINSVLSALVSQMTTQIISKGLSGLSSSGSGVTLNGRTNLNSYISTLSAYSHAPQSVINGGQVYTVQDGRVSSAATPAEEYASAISSLDNATLELTAARTACGSAGTADQTRLNILATIDADLASISTLTVDLQKKQAAVSSAYSASDSAAADATVLQAGTVAQTFIEAATGFKSTCGATPISSAPSQTPTP
jgi:hypothetical protein